MPHRGEWRLPRDSSVSKIYFELLRDGMTPFDAQDHATLDDSCSGTESGHARSARQNRAFANSRATAAQLLFT